jgi:hypothetical protein
LSHDLVPMKNSSPKPSVPQRGLRFWLVLLPALIILYVIGYFALMDRSRPEAFGAFKNYQLSFRWARPMPDKTGHATKYPGTTIWNVIYEPMDAMYFTFFPRTIEERQRLIDYGYDNRDLR